MIEVDGAAGEGGGQILRSALSLSICTAQPFRISNIRAHRRRPGLQWQHLTAVKAAAEICSAEFNGAEIGSSQLVFRPGRVRAGNYTFSIGTAGSCTLVLQTILPALLKADSASEVHISGGTHNKAAPPFEFLERAFLPLVARMGPQVRVELVRYGFYPRGGGQIRAEIAPVQQMRPLHLRERGAWVASYAEACIAAIPMHVAHRELETIRKMLGWRPEQLRLCALSNEVGPGNVVSVTIAHEQVTEVFTGFGERGVTAETVAKGAAQEARDYLATSAVAGPHLADQLLLPMGLCGAGSFTASSASAHLRTNATIVEQFLGLPLHVRPVGGIFEISIGSSP